MNYTLVILDYKTQEEVEKKGEDLADWVYHKEYKNLKSALKTKDRLLKKDSTFSVLLTCVNENNERENYIECFYKN